MSGGRRWTDQEQAALTEAVAGNVDLGQLAHRLNRTHDAVYRRAVSTGLIVPAPRRARRPRRAYHELFGD